MFKTIDWTGKNIRIIDQTRIPEKEVYLELETAGEVFEAIRKLRVRGAPAIGVAAAYGLYLGLRNRQFGTLEAFLAEAKKVAEYLAGARPTAVNLRWALQYTLDRIIAVSATPEELTSNILEIARSIQKDDETRCRKIGENGAERISEGMNILTHCNTGALATAGIGTALGVIYTAHHQNKKISVLVDETRPLLQGARLNMWELRQMNVPATLITDNMAAYAMQKGKVDLVIVGADRIAANGDVANKIGTYSLAVNCRHHGIPFYVAAPLSTFDFSISSGAEIDIEERDCREITHIWEKLPITVEGADCWNPAFDVTPGELITGIITEAGVAQPPYPETLKDFNHKINQNHKELYL